MKVKNSLRIILPLLLFCISIIVPSVKATTENFEQYDSGSLPCLPTPVSPGSTTFCTGGDDVLLLSSDTSDKQVIFNSVFGSQAYSTPQSSYVSAFTQHFDICDSGAFEFEVVFPTGYASQSTGAEPILDIIGGAGEFNGYGADNPNRFGPHSYNRISVSTNFANPDESFVLAAYTFENDVQTSFDVITTSDTTISSTVPYDFIISCPSGNNAGTVSLTVVNLSETITVSIAANNASDFVPSCYYTLNNPFFASTGGQFFDNIQYTAIATDSSCYDYLPPPPSNPSNNGCNANGDAEDNFIIINKTYIANQLCTSTKGLNWLLGLWLVCLVAVVAASVITGSPTVVGIAALVGIGISIGFGLFPVWFLLLIIFLIIILGGYFLGGDSGGAE